MKKQAKKTQKSSAIIDNYLRV